MSELTSTTETQTSVKNEYSTSHREFIEDILKMKRDIEEIRSYRQERNAAYAEVLDEVRNNLFDQQDDIHELKKMHREILDVLKGIMGRPGLIKESFDLQVRVKALEDWKRDTKSFIAGVIFVTSLLSAGTATFFGYVLHLFKS